MSLPAIALTESELVKRLPASAHYITTHIEAKRNEAALSALTPVMWRELSLQAGTKTLVKLGGISLRLGFTKYPTAKKAAEAELQKAYQEPTAVLRKAEEQGAVVREPSTGLSISVEGLPENKKPLFTVPELELLLKGMPSIQVLELDAAQVKAKRPALWEYICLKDLVKNADSRLAIAWKASLQELQRHFTKPGISIETTISGCRTFLHLSESSSVKLSPTHPRYSALKAELEAAQRAPGKLFKELTDKKLVDYNVAPYIVVKTMGMDF